MTSQLDKKLAKIAKSGTRKARDDINRDTTIYSILFAELENVYKDYKDHLIELAENIKDKKVKQKAVRSIKANKIPYKRMAKLFAKELEKELLRKTKILKLYTANDNNGYHFILIPTTRHINLYDTIQTSIRTIKKKDIFTDKTDPDKLVWDFAKVFLDLSHIGHERAASSVYSSRRTEQIKKLTLYKSKDHAFKTKFGKEARKVQNFELEDELVHGWNTLAVDLVKKTVKGKYTIEGITTLKFQSARTNLSHGAYQKELVVAFEKFINESFPTLLNQKNSPSIIQTIIAGIIGIFKGKKAKPIKKRGQKSRVKLTHKIKPKKHAQLSLSIAPNANELKKAFAALGEGEDLNSRIPELNTKLHDYIQRNMGKGGSKAILNYRTGVSAGVRGDTYIERFLPSKEKRAATAVVKYLSKPYGVFTDKGHHLYKPGRDPHRIFGRSIRQMLQEEKIATLRRVKVELRG